MKRNRLFILAAMLPALSAMQAQTSYEAANLLGTDLNGTARFVGMGGAMSALGADISTMGSNPAGIGLYRSWDLSMSFAGNGVTQRSQSNVGLNRSYDSYGSFDNIGIVLANKMSNENLVRFFNYGFNYRNVRRFDGKMGMSSNLYGLSQTGQMAWQAYEGYRNGNVYASDFDPASKDGFYQVNYYDDPNIGWLTLLGADGRLIDASALNEGSYYPSYLNDYTEHVSGGITACDFNASLNLADMVYLGVTFTTYDVERRMVSSYTEYFEGGEYTLDNYYSTVGSGYDFKFGAIVRPFSTSSFRIGVSATTPTVYTLTDYNSAVVNSVIPYYDNVTGEEWTEAFSMDTQSSDAFDGDCFTEYTMIAPTKYNVSLGGTIGTSLAMGLEYEYTDYSAAKLFAGNGNENVVMNEHTAAHFTSQQTIRFGLEKMFAGAYYARLGYNYQTSGYRSDAWKMIPINSVQTNTAYRNLRTATNFTCGLGYRGDAFYADAALLSSQQTADFYPFEDSDLEATKVSRSHLKGMLTIGFRF